MLSTALAYHKLVTLSNIDHDPHARDEDGDEEEEDGDDAGNGWLAAC